MLFVIAAGTDWLDGYYARKYGQVTTLGRILDPFADKVIVCGTFIFLVADPDHAQGSRRIAGVDGRGDRGPGIAGHGAAEFHRGPRLRFFGQDVGQAEDGASSASPPARACSIFIRRQAAAADCMSDWVWWVLVAFVWSSVVLTVYSGLVYIRMAVRLLRDA